MQILIKILKIIVILFLIACIIIGAIAGYDYYKSEKRKKRELTYKTTHSWQWHDEYNRIQIRFNEKTNKSVLRKVSIQENYIVYAIKSDEYKLLAFVEFIVPCEAGTVITTSKKYSSGKPKTLECNEEGDALFFGASWKSKDTNTIWEDNLDGFKFRVDFDRWDFTKLDQEITLSKAKKNADK